MAGCITGFLSFFRGVAFLFRHRLWGSILLPAILSLLLAFAAFYGVDLLLADFLAQTTQSLARSAALSPAVAKWTIFAARGAALFLSLILVLLLYQLLASLVVLPFLGPLLDETEKRLTGETIPVGFKDSLRNALLGFRSSLRYSLLGLLAFVLTLPLGPAQIFLFAPVEGYFLGRGSLDMVLEKQYRSLKERSMAAGQLRCETIGLGIAYFLTLLIPVVGVLIGPAASVVGSALFYYRRPTSSSIRSMSS